MEAVTLADYQRHVLRTAFRSAVTRGEARPFTLLACFVPTVVVPAVFIAVAGRHTVLRPLRYVLAAALVAFQVNQLTPLWNTDGTWARISSLNFACAYGAGISISWGTMWALNVLVWTDPWIGERVARRNRRGPPETGPDGIMGSAEAPDEDIARSLRLGHEYYWQSFPAHASFMARIDWAIDLCFAWRGVGWSWCKTPVPHFAPPIRPHTNELVRLSSIPESTRHGYSRHRTWASFYRSRLATFVGSYLVLDVCAVIMTNDPHFIVGPAPSRRVPWSEQTKHFPYPAMGDVRPAPPSPALFAIPAYLQALYRHPEWLELYRSLLGLVAMLAALQIALHLDQLLRISFAKLFMRPDSMTSFATATQLWHYPSPFGSVSQVLDHGLNGFWGSFWHQTLREGFSAPTQWLTEQGLLPSGHEAHFGKIESVTNGSSNSEKWKSSTSFNGDVEEDKNTKGVQDASRIEPAKDAPHKKPPTPLITRFVGLVLAFGQSALLHGAASMTTLPTHTLWQGPALFFICAGVGVALQSIVMPKPQRNKLSRCLHQAGEFLFALGWLHGTCWLFVDDQARSGIWLFEPVPFSPTRLIISLVKGGELPSIISPGGSNRAGHSAWRWYKDDFVHWYTGKTWWDTGIAL
ncbi:hypothetical protein SEPCBS57363_000719 [Sporothrix epigloea]|uniref:Wax synthase domain-containing protein n=1 Tax=Sporothrix epigloea TaxID=1892477 RepID=A0ABP0D9E0_9PEZI